MSQCVFRSVLFHFRVCTNQSETLTVIQAHKMISHIFSRKLQDVVWSSQCQCLIEITHKATDKSEQTKNTMKLNKTTSERVKF